MLVIYYKLAARSVKDASGGRRPKLCAPFMALVKSLLLNASSIIWNPCLSYIEPAPAKRNTISPMTVKQVRKTGAEPDLEASYEKVSLTNVH